MNKYPAKSSNTAYTFFESDTSREVNNKNEPKGKITQFPKGLYIGEALNPSYCQPYQFTNAGPGRPYPCQPYYRDKTIDYFFPTERPTGKHPDHFSRFAYPWCDNGYCTANFPGRYNTPLAFQWQSNMQPQDMAPDRFYSKEFQDPNRNISSAYIGSYHFRTHVEL